MADVLDGIALPGASDVVEVYDPLELDTTSTMTRRFARDMGMYRYMLLDRSLLRQSFDRPISRHLTRELGDVLVCKVGDRFATQLDIGGDGFDGFCFSRMTGGRIAATQDGREATSHGADGIAFFASPGTRTVASDNSGRFNVWINGRFLEGALAHLLGDRLRRPLRFRLDVAWDVGLAASVAAMFRLLEAELERPDGLAGNPVALRSLHDTLARTILLGLPNNYSDRLAPGAGNSVPVYVRRAEGFMHAHADEPIAIADVAAAAGCGVRTLETVFRQFRDTTPLAALHAIRLDRVRAELEADPSGAMTAAVARRYGFTNRHRFRLAYQLRFGHPPPSRRDGRAGAMPSAP